MTWYVIEIAVFTESTYTTSPIRTGLLSMRCRFPPISVFDHAHVSFLLSCLSMILSLEVDYSVRIESPLLYPPIRSVVRFDFRVPQDFAYYQIPLHMQAWVEPAAHGKPELWPLGFIGKPLRQAFQASSPAAAPGSGRQPTKCVE